MSVVTETQTPVAPLKESNVLYRCARSGCENRKAVGGQYCGETTCERVRHIMAARASTRYVRIGTQEIQKDPEPPKIPSLLRFSLSEAARKNEERTRQAALERENKILAQIEAEPLEAAEDTSDEKQDAAVLSVDAPECPPSLSGETSAPVAPEIRNVPPERTRPKMAVLMGSVERLDFQGLVQLRSFIDARIRASAEPLTKVEQKDLRLRHLALP